MDRITVYTADPKGGAFNDYLTIGEATEMLERGLLICAACQQPMAPDTVPAVCPTRYAWRHASCPVPDVKVGDGMTACGYTDRHAATVIKASGRRITIQLDTAIRVDSNGMSDAQTYRYEPNPNGSVIYANWAPKKARFVGAGYDIVSGRRHYYDFSF